MTRHTYRPGDAIDPGATYYPMDGARQRDPLEPEEVVAALDAWVEREEPEEQAEFAGYWIGPFEWRGGGERPGPLPPGVEIKPSCYSSTKQSHEMIWALRFRFRYRADNPAGWLPRGDWIPPAELWAEGCTVRCEWTPQYIPSDADHPSRWDHITHIRLVAREAKAGLPEAQPEPGAVPELPEWVREHRDGWRLRLAGDRSFWLPASASPDDLDRIAEACTKLAARERARRAGS